MKRIRVELSMESRKTMNSMGQLLSREETDVRLGRKQPEGKILTKLRLLYNDLYKQTGMASADSRRYRRNKKRKAKAVKVAA